MRKNHSSKAPLYFALVVVGAALFGCSSRYEPEGQFWPNQVAFGNGGAGAGNGTSNPTAGTQGSVAGSNNGGAPDVLPGFGGSSSSMGGSNVTQPGNGNAGGGVSGSAAFGGSSSGGSSAGGSSAAGRSTGGRSGSGGASNGGASNGGASSAGTSGTANSSATCSLNVSVTTTAPGGNYRPRNVGAIWIADTTGKFVKSLEVWGNQRLSHVTAWNAATRAAGVSGNKVDAVTSATLSAHRTHTVNWNCLNYNRQTVADGTYRVYFEVTDSNSSGPNHFENFAKGSLPVTVQTSSMNFNNISLTFKP